MDWSDEKQLKFLYSSESKILIFTRAEDYKKKHRHNKTQSSSSKTKKTIFLCASKNISCSPSLIFYFFFSYRIFNFTLFYFLKIKNSKTQNTKSKNTKIQKNIPLFLFNQNNNKSSRQKYSKKNCFSWQKSFFISYLLLFLSPLSPLPTLSSLSFPFITPE